MFKLIEIRDVVPKSLFITGITTKTAIGTPRIGCGIFQGEYEGGQVVLRLRSVLKVQDDVGAL